MNVIIPMAGMGKRLRPHTLTVPKPLIPIAGKPIVHHLVEDIAALASEPLERIVFVCGRFGDEAERHLIAVASALGAIGEIAYQDEPLGTAHAIWCAQHALKGKTIVAFADTLFRADFDLDSEADGVLWVKQIDDPSAFGVVQLNENGEIVEFVEKPATFVSNLAMIGIYYFKSGEALHEEIKYLIEHNIRKSGEYQLPDALRRLTQRGLKFLPGKVDSWMDCGNAAATVETNSEILQWKYPASNLSASVKMENAQIIDPCFIGEGVVLKNSVVGPFASIGAGTEVVDSHIAHSLVQQHNRIITCKIEKSMIGSHVNIHNVSEPCSLGDYSTIG